MCIIVLKPVLKCSQTPFNHRLCSVNIHPFPLTSNLVFIGSDARQALLVCTDGNYLDLWYRFCELKNLKRKGNSCNCQSVRLVGKEEYKIQGSFSNTPCLLVWLSNRYIFFPFLVYSLVIQLLWDLSWHLPWTPNFRFTQAFWIFSSWWMTFIQCSHYQLRIHSHFPFEPL